MTAAKAWAAGILSTLLAGASALAIVLTGDATLQTLTQAQWLGVIIAMLTTGGSVFGLTYAVTNKPGEVTEAQAASVLDKYTAPVVPAVPVAAPIAPVEAGGQGNGDIASS